MNKTGLIIKLLITGFTLLTGSAWSTPVIENRDEIKPNIVFILIDDLGWTDLGYMGSEYYETPNIDRLAQRGMIFTSAYANAANCAPTRACLLSGQYTPRHGVYTVDSSERGKPEDRRLIPVPNSEVLPPEKITIAEALKPAGYTSAAIGKWHVGSSQKEQGFDIGFDRDDIGYPYAHFNDEGEYLTERLTDEAIQFITDNNPQNTGSPFFLYLAHHAVHTPVEAPEDEVARFSLKETSGCHNHATYAAMIKGVDESVARITEALEKLGLSESTLLVFFSDNGGHGTFTCQKPLRGGKGMYYEGGIRVPMFAYWPGNIKAGSTCSVPVISTDFYPTFLDLANTQAPKGYPTDGVSIYPLLKGRKSLDRKSMYWHFPAYLQAYTGLTEDSRDPGFRSRPVSVIRQGDWKLLLYHEEWVLDGGRNKIDSNNAIELYNLEKDISESDNLALKETGMRDKLLNNLLEWIKDTKAPVPSEPNRAFKQNRE